jgi:hypothetical protein
MSEPGRRRPSALPSLSDVVTWNAPSSLPHCASVLHVCALCAPLWAVLWTAWAASGPRVLLPRRCLSQTLEDINPDVIFEEYTYDVTKTANFEHFMDR